MAIGRRKVLGACAGLATAGGIGALLASGRNGSTEPTVLVAGSLAGLAADVPGGAVEAHGSLAARRLVVSGARDPDALALADPSLFAGLDGIDSVEVFATNALSLAYDPGSDHADAIGRDWTAALSDPRLRVGRTDPRKDPLGYRTVLALRIAVDRGLLDRATARSILDRAEVFPETDLLKGVAVGKLDAAFVYRSMAHEVDVPAIDLPASVDLSDPALADDYAGASVTVDGRTFRGSPIRYGATPLTPAGEEWIRRLVEDTDRLRDHGFTVPERFPLRVPTGEL